MLISKSGSEEQPETKDQPVCPNCGAARESIIEQVPSPASFVISFISLFYFGIWCIFIIPLVFQSTKIIIKRCYYCNQELEKRKYFQLPNINDQVLQFRFGNCIIVVSRKYALILLAIIVSLFFYFEYAIEREQPQAEVITYANKSWVEFLQFCGKFQFVENGLKARHQFESMFKNKMIAWKGDFVQTKQNYDSGFPYSYWVYIKMNPTESAEDIPDLILGVNSSQYPIETFNNLEKGKPIHFDAKFLALGSEYNFHIFELKSLTIESAEQVEDIKKLHQFTIDMDKMQILKRSKLQDSLKHMIHMYNPTGKAGILSVVDAIQESQKQLTKEEIDKIEEDIKEEQVKINEENIQQESEKQIDEQQNNQEFTNPPQEVNLKIDESIREEIMSKDKLIKEGVIEQDEVVNEEEKV